MKKLLVLVMLFITSMSFSQKVNKDTLSAGDYMILSTEKYYDGISMVAMGSISISLAFLVSSQQISPDITISLGIAASIFTLIGTVNIIKSHSYIRKAGLLLNENGIGLRIKL